MPALAPLLALLVTVPPASPARADADGNLTEAFTISWLPARLGFADVPLADSLQELAPRGLTLASLERGSDVFRPGVGVRLLPPEAVTPWRVP